LLKKDKKQFSNIQIKNTNNLYKFGLIMHINRKVLILIVTILSTLSIFILGSVVINFIDYGKKSSISHINSLAESIRDGLISHMVNGTMDKSDEYLNNVIKHQNVQSLHVLRSKKIIEIYGEGEIESYKYDDIEKEVLAKGKIVTKLINGDDQTAIRVTIPYIASKYGSPNCMSCHTNVQEGEVLGAINSKGLCNRY